MSKNKVNNVNMRVKPISVKVAEIMRLCYLINKKTKYCAFLSFAGHVNSIDVSIRHGKVDYRVAISEVKALYLDKEKHLEEMSLAVRLDKITKNLKKLLSKKIAELDA